MHLKLDLVACCQFIAMRYDILVCFPIDPLAVVTSIALRGRLPEFQNRISLAWSGPTGCGEVV